MPRFMVRDANNRPFLIVEAASDVDAHWHAARAHTGKYGGVGSVTAPPTFVQPLDVPADQAATIDASLRESFDALGLSESAVGHAVEGRAPHAADRHTRYEHLPVEVALPYVPRADLIPAGGRPLSERRNPKPAGRPKPGGRVVEIRS